MFQVDLLKSNIINKKGTLFVIVNSYFYVFSYKTKYYPVQLVRNGNVKI